MKKGATMSKKDAKLKAKNKFAYKPLSVDLLYQEWPPYYSFIPTKQDLQVMIKKATTIKNVDEIAIETFTIE